MSESLTTVAPVVEFLTESLSEFKVVAAGDNFELLRRSMLGLQFGAFRTVAAVPTIVVGEPVRGVDIDGRPYNTSAVRTVLN